MLTSMPTLQSLLHPGTLTVCLSLTSLEWSQCSKTGLVLTFKKTSAILESAPLKMKRPKWSQTTTSWCSSPKSVRLTRCLRFHRPFTNTSTSTEDTLNRALTGYRLTSTLSTRQHSSQLALPRVEVSPWTLSRDFSRCTLPNPSVWTFLRSTLNWQMVKHAKPTSKLLESYLSLFATKLTPQSSMSTTRVYLPSQNRQKRESESSNEWPYVKYQTASPDFLPILSLTDLSFKSFLGI